MIVTRKIWLLTAVSLFALASSAEVATAQTSAQPAASATQTPAPPDDQIVVTGTRIARPEIEFANPVTSFRRRP